MATDWYCRKGDRKFGPFGDAQLKSLADSGEITIDDLVMREGHGQWVKASLVKGLFQDLSAGGGSQPPRASAPGPKQNGGDDDFYGSIVRSSEAASNENIDERPGTSHKGQDPFGPISLNEVLNVLVQSRQLLKEVNERDKSRKTLADFSIFDWLMIIVRFSIAYFILVVVLGVLVFIVVLLGMALGITVNTPS